MRHNYKDKSLDCVYPKKVTKNTTASISFRVLIKKKAAFLAKLKKWDLTVRDYFEDIVDKELNK